MVSERIDTQLALAALEMAYRRRKPPKRQYPTRSATQCDVFAYLESFYNTRRPRSALGWIPHSRFEEELCHSVA